jgi:hypothetical protein
LDLRIFLTSRNTWTASRFRPSSSVHMDFAPEAGNSTARSSSAQEYFHATMSIHVFRLVRE